MIEAKGQIKLRFKDRIEESCLQFKAGIVVLNIEEQLQLAVLRARRLYVQQMEQRKPLGEQVIYTFTDHSGDGSSRQLKVWKVNFGDREQAVYFDNLVPALVNSLEQAKRNPRIYAKLSEQLIGGSNE